MRAEGLEPGAVVIEVLDRWANGAIETEQLGEAARRIVAGESVSDLLGRPEPVSARR